MLRIQVATSRRQPTMWTYHSVAALRFGDYVAKLSATPLSANVKALTGQKAAVVGNTTMRDFIVDHFRRESAEYQLRAQLCVDPAAFATR
jgi:hypothetical protein